MSGAGVMLTMGFGTTQLQTLNAASAPAMKPEGRKEDALSDTIRVVDRLYDENKMKDALAYLESHSDSPEAEVLWRLARLYFKVSDLCGQLGIVLFGFIGKTFGHCACGPGGQVWRHNYYVQVLGSLPTITST